MFKVLKQKKNSSIPQGIDWRARFDTQVSCFARIPMKTICGHVNSINHIEYSLSPMQNLISNSAEVIIKKHNQSSP